jgi:hypothetical protein
LLAAGEAMTAFTAVNRLIGRAPKRIELLGDKTQRPEPAQHVIEFPGGAIEVSRTSDGNYWAHIIVHHGEPGDSAGFTSARGKVIDSRIGRAYPHGVGSIDNHAEIEQVAVLISALPKAKP